MNCKVCGAQVETDEQQCSKCTDMENKVQVLTLEEKQHFSGITVEQDEGETQEGHDQYQRNNTNQQMYSKQFSISSTSLLTKIFLGVILAGVFFIALPVAIVILSIVGIITFMVRK